MKTTKNDYDLAEYWKKRCELAETYIGECPCDTDVYESQVEAWNNWNDFKKTPPKQNK